MSNEISPTDGADAGDSASGAGAVSPDATPTSGSPRDRWWFTPTMWVAAGAAAVAFQWGPISGGSAKWLNWAVAMAGAALVLYGFAEGYRAWTRRPRTM